MTNSSLYTLYTTFVSCFTAEWNDGGSSDRAAHPSSGFAGLSTRSGRKPVIAAVNGLCFGGGCEIIINCDMVVASPKAQIGLPEVKRGVVALAGALPRLVRTVGRQRAMELALTGRTLSAQEAKDWGMVNYVADDCVSEAVRWATEIASNSPDSIIVSREGIKLGWEAIGAQDATEKVRREWFPRLAEGDNIKEGLMAFVEKRKPRWVDSKL
jgi:enoyl-CoA hydratase/carnithine racemase